MLLEVFDLVVWAFGPIPMGPRFVEDKGKLALSKALAWSTILEIPGREKRYSRNLFSVWDSSIFPPGEIQGIDEAAPAGQKLGLYSSMSYNQILEG